MDNTVDPAAPKPQKKFEKLKAFVAKYLPGSSIAISLGRMTYFMFLYTIREMSTCLTATQRNGPTVARIIIERLGQRVEDFPREVLDRFIRYCNFFLNCLAGQK